MSSLDRPAASGANASPEDTVITVALLVLTAAPGSDAEHKLRLLAVLGQERFTRTAPE